MTLTMKNVSIERLPETKEPDGAKRWVDEKGEFVQVSYREDIGHVAFFELIEGQSRGNHYHERKEEIFYVISGKIRAHFMDMESGERQTAVLEKGMKIRVKTGTGHIFHGIENSYVIEYSPQYYDKEDAHKIDMRE